ncbi:hypothetical protein [Pseudomonas sp. B21-032]|uniref:hypothetical protein n=1 Tax=Pseudomonas sp. B21-032 TaxID=2895483 RepID=UPI002852E9CF|nr:hypothetical protein [Pseudomonas sp. B21-032]
MHSCCGVHGLDDLEGAEAMIPRQGFLRRQLESALILLAAWILGGRNVTRSPVVSRKDNNEMFEMDFELRAIARRIRKQYSE